jgi:hypothetical protein
MAAKLKIGKRGDVILIVHCCFPPIFNEEYELYQSKETYKYIILKYK